MGFLDWIRNKLRKPQIPANTGEEEIAENFDDPEVVFRRRVARPDEASATLSLAAPDTIKRNVCLITVKFSDSSALPTSNDTVWRVFKTGDKNVYDFYESMSYGATYLTGKVFGPFTITRGTGCNYRDWIDQAKAKLAATGVDLTQFTNFAVFGPANSDCGFAGIASVSGNYLYMNGVATWATLAHELGHNFGLGHARASTCPIGYNCPITTYGNPYDRMGNGSHGFQAQSRMYMGILSANNIKTVSATGTYTLEPLETTTNGVKLIRVPRGDGSFINIETRRAVGAYAPAPSSYAVGGIMVNIGDKIGRNALLIDTHGTTSTKADAPILPGETWVDPLSKARIKCVANYATHARVGITIPTVL